MLFKVSCSLIKYVFVILCSCIYRCVIFGLLSWYIMNLLLCWDFMRWVVFRVFRWVLVSLVLIDSLVVSCLIVFLF